MENALGYLTLAFAIIVLLSEFYMAARVRSGPTYWPVLRIQTAMTSARAVHLLGIFFVHVFFHTISIDIFQLFINFLIGATLSTWSAYLVRKRNLLTPGLDLDDYGRVIHQTHRDALFHAASLNALVQQGIIQPQDYVGNRDFRYGIIDPAYDGLVGMNKDGNITSFGLGAQRIFGWAEQEVVGKSVTILMPARYQHAHTSGMKHLLETGVGPILGQVLEVPAVDRLGREFRIYLTVTGLNGIDGEDFVAIMRAVLPGNIIKNVKILP